MADRWGDDPTLQLWTRWRRPVLAVVSALFVIGQWDRITSGEPFTTATGLGLVFFWVSSVWLPVAPPPQDRIDATAWRRHGRRSALFFGGWCFIACVWLALAAYLYDVRALNFIVPAIPAILTGLNLLGLARADKTAALHRQIAER